MANMGTKRVMKPESKSKQGSSLHSETDTSTSMTGSKPSSSSGALLNRFRLVTWNIDGLDRRDILGRTGVVCDTLKSLSPDVIFLQEVVPETLPLVQERLGELYEVVPRGQRNAYFTLTLIKRSPDISVTETTIRAFPKTKMARNLLIVKALCYGVKLTLMNTHLESRMQDRPERMNQLSQCMVEMKAQGSETVAIFGGDTNLDNHDVVPETLPFIQDRLGALYELVPGGQRNAYFTLTLIKRSPDINVTERTIRAFPNTKLGRNLLIVKAVCYGVKMTLMNTHLESRMKDRPERRNQLSQCMAEMKAQGSETVAIFGGDTNLDNHDVEEVDIPAGILDVWEVCGRQMRTMNTKDTTINQNVPIKSGGMYKLRLDRIFIRPAGVEDTSRDDHVRNLKIASFDLIGKERISACNNRFPSDHWGVVCEFDIV